MSVPALSEKHSAPEHTALGRVSESGLQRNDGTGSRNFDWHIIFGNSHPLLLSTRVDFSSKGDNALELIVTA